MQLQTRVLALFSALVLSPCAASAQDVPRLRHDLVQQIEALPDTPPQKAALRQLAGALEATLEVNSADQTALQAAAAGLNAAINCAWSVYAPEVAPKRIEEVTRHAVDTRARKEAYARYNQARSGSVISLPNHDTCR